MKFSGNTSNLISTTITPPPLRSHYLPRRHHLRHSNTSSARPTHLSSQTGIPTSILVYIPKSDSHSISRDIRLPTRTLLPPLLHRFPHHRHLPHLPYPQPLLNNNNNNNKPHPHPHLLRSPPPAPNNNNNNIPANPLSFQSESGTPNLPVSHAQSGSRHFRGRDVFLDRAGARARRGRSGGCLVRVKWWVMS